MGAENEGPFRRLVCAVEPSPAGLDVLERTRRVASPDAVLVALTAFDAGAGATAGWEVAPYAHELRLAAEEVNAEAERRLALEPRHRAVLRTGRAVECIRREIDALAADLVAVGTHGHGRAAGIVFGSVSTTLLHDAPCPVLLCRPVGPPFRFPRTLVIGVDGSPQSLHALAVGRELAGRLGIPMRTIVATGGKPVEVDGLVAIDDLEWLNGEPVDGLAGSSEPEDLLVVGSRGLHGFAAVGSVSERVAHEARCSVLVVRPRRATCAAARAAAAGAAGMTARLAG